MLLYLRAICETAAVDVKDAEEDRVRRFKGHPGCITVHNLDLMLGISPTASVGTEERRRTLLDANHVPLEVRGRNFVTLRILYAWANVKRPYQPIG